MTIALHIDAWRTSADAGEVAPEAAAAARTGRTAHLELGFTSGEARASAPGGSGCCYVPVPASYGFELQPGAIQLPARGYAPSTCPSSPAAASAATPASTAAATASLAATATASKSATATTGAAGTTVTKAELAFLDDKTLSVEDKLYRFMALMAKKQDEALEAAMRSYADRKEAAAKKASASSGGGLLSLAGDVVGGLGSALGEVGGAVVKGAKVVAKDLGGPLLAAAVTAVGLPQLAPVALQVGGTLGKALVEGVASAAGIGQPAKKSTGSTAALATAQGDAAATASASTASSTSSSTSTSAADDFDEKLEMLGLQRMVEKGNALFAALSNALKSMHDTQLSVVANIR